MASKAVWALVALFSSCLSAASAQAKSDSEFLGDAIKGDNSEIVLGKLAVEKSSSRAVKSFGRALERDHRKAKRQATAVARKVNSRVPNGLTDEATQEQQKLEALSGAAFDREFAAYMVSDHQKDISEFQDEAKAGRGEVAKLAEKTLPTLRKHLKLAQSLKGH
ncbi:DUF4142 domain-containing protein [Mesorhizobium sp. B2-1-3A]|uniref:DUF4142 domain-containing protein n=1 Tax=Mesorhizobium sp. B2-1-3A TaxID=2589971 RepID=UPI0011292CD1|nr:DUF4142 domain-containing protein [Mesorhizobium sp. B2-1-3A]TPM96683.1 DUF4142 domain-containing protein [Mesorhizobium sp. B2-1-3A]